MRNKKYVMMCGILAASLCIVSLTGCGKNNTKSEGNSIESAAGENSFAYEDTDKDAPTDETVNGMVKSISGNVITISVMPQAGQNPGGDGKGEQPPEMPSGNDAQEGEQPPEMPSGNDAQEGEQPPEMPSGNDAQEGEQPPEMPSGDDTQSGEQPQGMNDMDTATLTVSDETVIRVKENDDTSAGSLADITENTMISITFDENGNITEILVQKGMDGGQGGPGQQQENIEYDSVVNYDEDTSTDGEKYTSTGEDENAILVNNGAKVSLINAEITRDAGESQGGDSASFYGVGAAVLTTDGTTTVENADIKTTGNGAAGIFAYGNGTVNVSDSQITTTGNTAGGIHVAGGGSLYAKNLSVETSGESSAAIRSDRGGGTMVVNGGQYVSNGVGSPAVYCTADIAVNNSELTANGSEAICMEGKNKLHLFDCDITGNMSDLDTNDTTWDVIVYQSMSGDSEEGTSELQLIGGSLSAKNGGLIYTTNTDAEILMSDVDVSYADDSEFFLRCTGNNNKRGWGTTGKNGSDCNFTADKQEMKGDVIWDSISNLEFYMTNESVLTGAIVDDETYAGEGGNGGCTVNISKDSKWVVTGDSNVTSLNNEGTIVDEDGNTVAIVGTDGTIYVEGDSNYSIIVNSYSDTADMDDALQAASWSDYEQQ